MSDRKTVPPGTQTPTQGPASGSGIEPNPHAMGPAIVLSGGGAKGDFEVGAVRCLYNNGIQPKILCGTSVGSVNALKLAEGETSPAPTPAPAGHVRGLAGLEKIWLGLNVDQDMWTLDPIVADLFKTIKQLPADLQKVQSDGSAVVSDTIGGFLESIVGIPGFFSFAPQASALNQLNDDAQTLIQAVTVLTSNAGNVQGMINYDPLQALMREPANFFPAMQAASGIMLRLAMVALEDGALRYVSETNTMLERNGAVTVIPPGPTPAELAQWEAQAAQLQAEVNRLMPSGGGGLPYQKPGPGLSSARQELANLQIKINWYTTKFDLIRAAIASSSLPVICQPTIMEDSRTYVDGGVRTLAPIQAAIDVGASIVYAVAAGSQQFQTESMATIGGSTPLPLLGIALRVGEDIMPDEVARRDLTPDNPYPVPVMLIQPDPNLPDVHDALTLEPGLIRIRMAYGFMRAYDTLMAFKANSQNTYLGVTATNSQKARTMDIVQLRARIWSLEYPANGKEFVLPTSALPPEPYRVKETGTLDATAHAQAKALKAQLATLVQDRITFYTDHGTHTDGTVSLPADFATWSTQWEKHSWAPVVPL